MKTLKIVFALFVVCTGLASCNSATKSLRHQGKKNPCFFSDEKGTIKPYQSEKERVTEHYHFRNALNQE